MHAPIRCAACKKSFVPAHGNTRRCGPCATYRVRVPPHGLTDAQVEQALALRGTMYRKEIAERIGCDGPEQLTLLGRALAVSFAYGTYASRPQLVREVVAYYRQHGAAATQQRYPSIKVRNLLGRYDKSSSRQARWQPKQIRELAKMGGLLPYRDQAAYFNRPRAKAGSIRSAWGKIFGQGPSHIHGLSMDMARQILQPPYKTVTVLGNTTVTAYSRYSIVLWVDAQKSLRPDLPEFLRESIDALATFQRWLYGAHDARGAILRMMRRRAVTPPVSEEAMRRRTQRARAISLASLNRPAT